MLGFLLGLIGFIFIAGFIMIAGLFWIMFISVVLFVFAILYYISAKKSEDTHKINVAKILLIVTTLLMVFILGLGFSLMGFGKETNNKVSSDNTSFWAKDYTPIDDFYYTLDGNNIYLIHNKPILI